MSKENVSAFLKKYTMVIVLVVVTLFFTWKTGGRMLLPQNVNNLISQNSYVSGNRYVTLYLNRW